MRDTHGMASRDAPYVAVIGASDATEWELAMAEEVGRRLARVGAVELRVVPPDTGAGLATERVVVLTGESPTLLERDTLFRRRGKRRAATAMEYLMVASFIITVLVMTIQHLGSIVGGSMKDSAQKVPEGKKAPS